MKKYLIFRAPKRVDRDLGKHELIGVEYGANIDAATKAIVRAVTDDLSGNPEYAGLEVSVYGPGPVEKFRKTKRYQYYVMSVVFPVSEKKIISVDYGIMEREEP